MAREVRVGLIGFGTIGTGVVKLLQRNQAQIRSRLGTRLSLARIADIDLRTDRGVKVDRRILTNNAEALIDDPFTEPHHTAFYRGLIELIELPLFGREWSRDLEPEVAPVAQVVIHDLEL